GGARRPRPRGARPPGPEPLFQHVADRVQGGAVAARDDELPERRGSELVERDLPLVRRPLPERGARTGLDLRRERIWELHRAAHEREEELEIAARIAWSSRERLEPLLHLRV